MLEGFDECFLSHRIIEYSEFEGTHEDHQIHLLTP